MVAGGVVRPPYQAVARLCVNAEHYWARIDGEAVWEGINLLDLPIDRFLNAIETWMIKRVKDVDRFLYEINKPVAGMGRTATEGQLNEEANAFMAFAAMQGVTAPTVAPGPAEPEN